MKGDTPRATLTYGDVIVETEVNDKLFNSAETDYHKVVCDKLIALLGDKLDLSVDKTAGDPWKAEWGTLKKTVETTNGLTGGAAPLKEVRIGEEPAKKETKPEAKELSLESEEDDILHGTAKEVAAYIRNCDDKDQLKFLQDAEESGKKRKTVLDALDEKLVDFE